MNDLIVELFTWVLGTPYAQYAVVLAFTAFVITHTLPFLPVSVTSKIPNVVMVILNTLAGQYGNASNAKTDISGNPK